MGNASCHQTYPRQQIMSCCPCSFANAGQTNLLKLKCEMLCFKLLANQFYSAINRLINICEFQGSHAFCIKFHKVMYNTNYKTESYFMRKVSASLYTE